MIKIPLNPHPPSCSPPTVEISLRDGNAFTVAEDIVQCWCDDCKGAHASGSKVTIAWPDGKSYSGVFRRAYVAKVYSVRLRGASVVDCSRTELYGPKEMLPKIVQERLKPVK